MNNPSIREANEAKHPDARSNRKTAPHLFVFGTQKPKHLGRAVLQTSVGDGHDGLTTTSLAKESMSCCRRVGWVGRCLAGRFQGRLGLR